MSLHSIKQSVIHTDLVKKSGKVSQITGLTVQSSGPDAFLGELCQICSHNNKRIKAEVVALKNGNVHLMPYTDVKGIYLGSDVESTGQAVTVSAGEGLLGRVIDAFGQPLDGVALSDVDTVCPLYVLPVNPLKRKAIDEVIETGVKSIDSLLTIGVGQRIGIFSGSGVGKSTLLGMIAKNIQADINVIALVGERGREVNEFLEKSLGKEGLKKSVVVVATSDDTALTRTHAALSATAIAEYFRDKGKKVVLMMDSVTRYAMALREIGLAIGEPPTSRGYTPSVFSAIPKLVERCGNTDTGGSITAFYTVLVDGDDMNDPVADNLRATLDGHIILSRQIANEGQFPAIDVMHSISRLRNELTSSEDQALVQRFLDKINMYQNSKDMINIGAYKRGSNPELDSVIKILPEIKAFLRQDKSVSLTRAEGLKLIKGILDVR